MEMEKDTRNSKSERIVLLLITQKIQTIISRIESLIEIIFKHAHYLYFMIAFILLFYDLGGKDYWADEVWHINNSKQPVLQIVSWSLTQDAHPPVTYVVAHFLLDTLGENEFLLRFFFALCGLLTLIVSYLLTKSVFEQRVATLSMLLISISPCFLLFSRMVRYYSISMLLGVLSAYLFVHFLADGRRRWLVMLTVADILFVYSQYFNWFLILAQWIFFVYVLFRGQVSLTAKAKKGFLLSQLIVVLCFLPIAYFLAQRVLFERAKSLAITADFGQSPLFQIGYVPVAYATGQTILPTDLFFVPLLVIVLSCFLLGVIPVLGKSRTRGLVLVTLMFLVPLLCIGLSKSMFAFKSSFIYSPNNGLYLLPLFWIIVSYGIVKVPGLFLRNLLLLVIVFLSAIGVINYYRGVHFINPIYVIPSKQIIEEVVQNAKDGDIAICDIQTGIQYYYKKRTFNIIRFMDSTSENEGFILSHMPVRLWVIQSNFESIPSCYSDDFLAKLREKYRLTRTYSYVPIDRRFTQLKEKLLQRKGFEYKYFTELYTLSEKNQNGGK